MTDGFKHFKTKGGFFGRYTQVVRSTMIPYQYEDSPVQRYQRAAGQLEKQNSEKADRQTEGGNYGGL